MFYVVVGSFEWTYYSKNRIGVSLTAKQFPSSEYETTFDSWPPIPGDGRVPLEG